MQTTTNVVCWTLEHNMMIRGGETDEIFYDPETKTWTRHTASWNFNHPEWDSDVTKVIEGEEAMQLITGIAPTIRQKAYGDRDAANYYLMWSEVEDLAADNLPTPAVVWMDRAKFLEHFGEDGNEPGDLADYQTISAALAYAHGLEGYELPEDESYVILRYGKLKVQITEEMWDGPVIFRDASGMDRIGTVKHLLEIIWDVLIGGGEQ